ncbi:MAG: VanZ family protein [Oscillospiraceae bacterium]|nr:VanZ family protein [Oscillospiraceae bacterium]
MKRLVTLLLLLLLPLQTDALTRTETREENTVRIDYIDRNGELAFNREMGYASRVETFDEMGRLLSRRYYDENGLPAEQSGGECAMLVRYSEDGSVSETSFADAEGKTIQLRAGYAMERTTHIGTDKLEEYFDFEGQPAMRSLGQYAVYKKYDADGNMISRTYLGRDGEAIVTSAGYTSTRREYDGDRVYDWYLDAEGNPFTTGRGQYGLRLVYEYGEQVGTVPIDRSGKDIIYPETYLAEHPTLVILAAAVLSLLLFLMDEKLRAVFLCAYVLFILYMTLLTREENAQKQIEAFASLGMVLRSSRYTLEVLNNILLFVPLGLCTGLLWKRPWSLPVCILLSLLIECSQYVTGLGFCQLDDLIGNSAGAAAGYAAAFLWMRKKKTG